MTRIMYDAVTPANIPTSAVMVAGYVDGLYKWTAADWARFPNAVHVPIAVFASTNAGVCLDIEARNATPAQAPGWVKRRRAAGVDPSTYCSYGDLGHTWALVVNEFHRQGVPEPHYWVAGYPGCGQSLYPGSVAHQWIDDGPYDRSVVADYWPGVDPAPTPPKPKPVPPTPPKPKPAPPTPAPKPTRNIAQTVAIQRACHVTSDGKWGSGLQIAASAVIRRTLTSVRALQGWVGTKVDGVWGPLSEAARINTVKGIQRAIYVTADGSWGPISSRAWAHAVANNLNRY